MGKLFNLAKMSLVAGATLTLGSAIPPYMSFVGVGVSNNDFLTYAIRDGANSEIGFGVYSAGVVTRIKVLNSTNGNAALAAVTASAQIAITHSAQDFGDVHYNALAWGAVGDGVTDDTPAIQRLLDTGKSCYMPPPPVAYKVTTLSITVSGTRIFGASSALSVMTSASTTADIIQVAANIGNITIQDLGFTRSVTASSGASAIHFLGYVDTSHVLNNEIQKNVNGVLLSSTGYSNFDYNFVHNNSGDGTSVTNTSTNGNLQWSMQKNLWQFNGLRGCIFVSSAGPAQVTCGNLSENDSFCNGSFSLAFAGSAGVPINGVRIDGGFLGSDNNSEIFLDTFGGQHQIKHVFCELAGTGISYSGTTSTVSLVVTGFSSTNGVQIGQRAIGAGIPGGTTVTAVTPTTVTISALPTANATVSINFSTGVGSGIEITANNLDVSVLSTTLNGNSVNGIRTLATVKTVVGMCTIANNTAAGALFGDGNKSMIFGCTFTNNTGGVCTVTSNPLNIVAFANSPAINPGQYPATATNDNAVTGNIGEILESKIATGSAVAVATSGTPQNITGMTITLLPGNWMVALEIYVYDSATTVLHNYDTISISTTSGALDMTLGRFAARIGGGGNIRNNLLPATGGVALQVMPYLWQVNANTQLFAVTQCGWSGAGTPTLFGTLYAWRPR